MVLRYGNMILSRVLRLFRPASPAAPLNDGISKSDARTQLYESLLRDRIVFLGAVIDAEVAKDIRSKLLFLDRQSGDVPITLLINSPGGAVYPGLEILDTMASLKCKVHTACLGVANSMAAILLTAGFPGFRKVVKDSQISFGAVRRGAFASENNEEIVQLNELLVARTSMLTGLRAEIVHELFSFEKTLSAYEAQGLGIIDEILPALSKPIIPS